ncbi:efflux transporter outer membrane subunit [Persicirhabdus sediminis]|uniref:Efflux transporter outer membrane subunit n=1 Tax=Persicirhabdus sediminis TaxID=454144 RepID=A0A8J7MG26_9BACT|nr:efflux transporter outer membrane subunit [Persicirhabdus sediminis]MBK1792200.1 efflux transporter outer membrane subunit [Persicirhabdus sediminis]
MKWILPITCLSLFACTVSEPPVAGIERVDIPSEWSSAGKGQSKKISTGWVSDFRDPQLTKLVNEAMNANPDVLATAQRLRVVKASSVKAGANRQPNVDGSLSATGRHDEGNYDGSAALSFRATWEADLWGRLRDLQSAADADYYAAQADLRSARLSLAANTARSWYQLISAEESLELARITLDSYQKNLRIISRNYRAGDPSTRVIHVQLARTNVYSTEQRMRSQTRARDDARRSLETLLGRYPAAKLSSPKSLPSFPRDIPVGMPLQLIERRPDLVAAREDIYAAGMRADAARKNLLPNLSLNASVGQNSSDLAKLLDPSTLASQVGANLAAPLYDAGSRRADVDAAAGRYQAQIHTYVSRSLNAFREVENYLAAETSLREQEEFLLKEVEQAALAEKQAERDYAQGIDGADVLNLLEAQRRALNARSSIISLRSQRIQNRINLYLALGGDFSTQASS